MTNRGPHDVGWRRIICVASGPSLSDAQKAIISAECGAGRWRVIVTNSTWRTFPDADAMWGADPGFWFDYHNHSGAFRGERWTGDAPTAAQYGLRHAPLAPARDGTGIAKDRRLLSNGGNSGHHTAALAYAKGMVDGILVGYDMQRAGGRVNRDGILVSGPVHHHGPHDGVDVRGRPLANPQPAALASWSVRFAVLADDLRAAGVRLTNCTIETALQCVERGELAATLESYKQRLVA